MTAAAITRNPNGFDDIDFQVPDGVSGCAVSIAIANHGAVSNYAAIPVGARGTPCSLWKSSPHLALLHWNSVLAPLASSSLV